MVGLQSCNTTAINPEVELTQILRSHDKQPRCNIMLTILNKYPSSFSPASSDIAKHHPQKVRQFIPHAKTCSWQREVLVTAEHSQCGIKELNHNYENCLTYPTMSQSQRASRLVGLKVRTDQFAADPLQNWSSKINGVAVHLGPLILMALDLLLLARSRSIQSFT